MPRMTDLIAPCFYKVWGQIKKNSYTHYWFSGGRSSTKSSFISLALVLLLIKDPDANGIVFRKVKDSIGDSVYEQIQWAIDILGFNSYFVATKSPFKIEYKPTGQRILFRGMDDPQKIKSIKLKRGYFKLAWFEELAEFSGMEEIESALLSIMRGGEGKNFTYFYSYNPPERMTNWVNAESVIEKPNRLIVKNSYLDVPREWLGEEFFKEAEHAKKVNETRYRHVYLGEITGTGGTVFPNAEKLEMSDEMVNQFDRIRQGVDWGFVVDPFVFLKLHYDSTRNSVYIFDEIYAVGMSNRRAIEEVEKKADPLTPIYADSAEPKSIREFKDAGVYMKPADKGQGSVEFGIKFLQSMDHIYIDPNRCPNTWREFSLYELEKDKHGNWKTEPPDKDNHCLVGNTLVSTDKGLVKIKNIKQGDFVLTRSGYKKILWAGCSGINRKVYKIRTKAGRYLIGTGNHRIFTSRGFIRIDELLEGDKLFTEGSIELCGKLKQSVCLGKSGTDTLNQKDGLTAPISKGETCIYTISYGKNITENGKADMLSTIKTGTPQTTRLKTWKRLPHKSIVAKDTALEGKNYSGCVQTLNGLDRLPANGTEANKVLNGTKNTQNGFLSGNSNTEKDAVKSAEKSTKGNQPERDFVVTTVSQNGAGNPELTTSLKNVNYAAKNLSVISTAGIDFVEKVVVVGFAKKVYDLTVDEKHEFFANGILVHNCIDSARYSLCKDNSFL